MKKGWIVFAVILLLAVFGSVTENAPGHDNVRTAAALNSSVSAATPKPTPTEDPVLSSMTMSQKQAYKKANSYLRTSSFSSKSLIDQLVYSKFDQADAEIAVAALSIDWKEQALKKAKSYLKTSAFSANGLYDQLLYSGFTSEEANYGVDNCGADWKEQAAKKAESYLKTSSFSREGLIDQLIYSGFTPVEAEYGVQAVGY